MKINEEELFEEELVRCSSHVMIAYVLFSIISIFQIDFNIYELIKLYV